MAQQFTHNPKAPEIHPAYADQRQFLRNIHRGVMRFEHRDVATILLESADGLARHSQHLKADECEELARALLDAAHDLRTYAAAAWMPPELQLFEATA